MCVAAHYTQLTRVRHDVLRRKEGCIQAVLSSILPSLSVPACRSVQRAIDFQTSGWLTVLPFVHHQFDLSPQQFHDALSLRYHRPMSMMPNSCDGCGTVFSVSHALDCRRGGLVTQRHNEVRDALGDLAALAHKEVLSEPVMCCGDASTPALIADLGVRGVWLPQIEALFHIRVTDVDAALLHLMFLVLLLMCWLLQRRKRNASTGLLLKNIMPRFHHLL